MSVLLCLFVDKVLLRNARTKTRTPFKMRVNRCTALELQIDEDGCRSHLLWQGPPCTGNFSQYSQSSWTAISQALCINHNNPTAFSAASMQMAWLFAFQAVVYLPFAGLLSGLLGVLLLWAIPGYPGPCIDVDAVDVRANQIIHEIRDGVRRPDKKQYYKLCFEFGLFFFDILTDIACMVELAITGQNALAIMQLAIFLTPILIDIYLGKMQISELCAGFIETVSRGRFPPNNYLRALHSEKGFEAPLSLALQYHFLPRNTSGFGFWCMLVSIFFSILGLTKFVYEHFELGLMNLTSQHSRNGTDRSLDCPDPPAAPAAPPSTIPPQSPAFPPGLARPPGPAFPPGLARPPGPAFPPGLAGVAPPAAIVHPPIVVDYKKTRETE